MFVVECITLPSFRPKTKDCYDIDHFYERECLYGPPLFEIEKAGPCISSKFGPSFMLVVIQTTATLFTSE